MSRRLHIRHLVRSDGFAGVERYLTYVAPELARRGHQVSVVGGPKERMRSALVDTPVTYLPADTLVELGRQAMAGPRPDVLHTHMTAADLAAIGPAALMRRPVVSTLHFAGGRGHSPLTRLAYRGLGAGLGVEVAVSEYVARTAPGHPRVVTMGIPAPVPTPGSSPEDLGARQPVVLVAQRLEQEKATDVAIRAWARSGLAELGWRLVVAGSGAEGAAARGAGRATGHGPVHRLRGPRSRRPGPDGHGVDPAGPPPGRGLRADGGRGHGRRPAGGGRGRWRSPRDAGAGHPRHPVRTGRRRRGGHAACASWPSTRPAGPQPPARCRIASSSTSASSATSMTWRRSTWTPSPAAGVRIAAVKAEPGPTLRPCRRCPPPTPTRDRRWPSPTTT